MCLIGFAYHCHPKYSLILIANRDEFYARPSDLLAYWQDNPNILAGRDQQKQGTWLGINTRGQIAAVTNYRDGRKHPSSDLRSRGELTRNFLSTHQSAPHYLEQLKLEQNQFGDFNLLVGTPSSGLYYFSNTHNRVPEPLKPGIYGLSNAQLDTPWPKLTTIKGQLSQAIENEQLDVDSLIGIMSDPKTAPDTQLPDTGISAPWEKTLSSIFINTETYGTRATTVLLQEHNGKTQVTEQSYDQQGKIARRTQTLCVPPL